MPKKIKCIGITGRAKNKLAKKVAKKAISMLESKGINCIVAEEFRIRTESALLKDFDCDIIMVFGGDGTILHTFREVKKQIPVVGVNCGTIGHLTEVNSNHLSMLIKDIVSGDYYLEKRARISAVYNGKRLPLALNELAVAPVRSNTIMRYKVSVDGEEILSDLADGLIVSTPTGSTAHALSAGGPILEPNVDAFVIVPVNSMDQNKRPIIVKDRTKIEVSDLASKAEIEVVLDGHVHFTIQGKIIFERGRDALFLKARKQKHIYKPTQTVSLTPTSKFIIEVLTHHGMLTRKEIIEHTQLPARTISRALHQLLDKGFISEKQFLLNEKVKGYMLR